ncbi:TPA: hypothetical protein DCZ31_03575 [Patescibacteria group bacterium]|nr:hypothetical protein [Candidatus Gracilibacteria bacterium]
MENIIPKFNFSLSFSLKRFDLKGFLVITRNDRRELEMTSGMRGIFCYLQFIIHLPHLHHIIPPHIPAEFIISVAWNSQVPVFCQIILILSQIFKSPEFALQERVTLNLSHLIFEIMILSFLISSIIPHILHSLGFCHIC